MKLYHRKFTSISLAVALAAAPGACATLQQYTDAANATANVLKTIGQDVVTFDCGNADLAYVIAKDLKAAQRVQDALAANMQLAHDACPALMNGGKVIVQTGAVVGG